MSVLVRTLERLPCPQRASGSNLLRLAEPSGSWSQSEAVAGKRTHRPDLTKVKPGGGGSHVGSVTADVFFSPPCELL